MNSIRYIIYPALIVLATSCFQAPKYDEVPAIELVSVNRARIPSNQGDSVIIVFTFKDGDGDLGKRDNNDTVPNIFLTDRRFSLVDSLSYSIPNIPQRGSVPDISGEVQINVLAKMFCNPLNPGAAFDTIVFDLRVRDRAGNFSNEITTPPIVLQCN